MITYQIEPGLGKEEFLAVLASSTLGERRPVREPERIAAMLRHADLILTARDDGKLSVLHGRLPIFGIAPICRIWRSTKPTNERGSEKS